MIDDLSREPPMAAIGSNWQLFTDQVMGGVSKAIMTRDAIAGRAAICMRGDVSLENNGGFVQIALDLSPDGVGSSMPAPGAGSNSTYSATVRSTAFICGRTP
jgi:2-keto-3-deoxy-6-phosphogluconate aldolase